MSGSIQAYVGGLALAGMVGLAAIGGFGATPASAAIFPYVEDFEGVATPGDAGFTTVNPGWSIDSNATTGSNALRTAATSDVTSIYRATTQVTGVPADSYVASTQMVVNALSAEPAETSGIIQTGLVLGANSDQAAAPSLLLDIAVQGWGGNTPGQFRIVGFGTGPGGANEISPNVQLFDSPENLKEDVIYTLTAVLTDNGTGGLNINFTVSEDGGPSVDLNFGITNASVLGDFFGVRSRTALNATSPTHDISFDNFSVVPEPAALGLAGLAGLMALRRRRA